MNKHSIIRLITVFFIIIFLLINTLFWVAHQHFSKQQELQQMQRFLLADKLLHHPDQEFSSELSQLQILESPLSHKKLLENGKNIIELPFGKILKYRGNTYFTNTKPPPPPDFEREKFKMAPPHKHKEFKVLVLKDIQKNSAYIFWLIVIAVDILVLLFFTYLMKKLFPLYQLKNAIRNFKEGDLELDIVLKGSDEISQISQEFNIALKKIANMKEARSLFLRNILHELKTPIMKGSLTAECIEESLHQERLKRVFQRMDYLLNEFAKMEHFNSGEWHLNLQEYRFVDLLDHACDMLLCEKENIFFNANESNLILKVDFELFTIALKNLLDNALKYSNEKPSIKITGSSIEICSSGREIPLEKQDFSHPFNRDYEDSSAGLGLGLYITDSILNKHNYRLEYRFKGHLNCFYIVFFPQN